MSTGVQLYRQGALGFIENTQSTVILAYSSHLSILNLQGTSAHAAGARPKASPIGRIL
jgi:hypothetical protein